MKERGNAIKVSFCGRKLRDYLRRLFCEVLSTKLSSVFLMVQSCDKNSLKVQCWSVYFGKQNAICRSKGMERLRQGKAFSLYRAAGDSGSRLTSSGERQKLEFEIITNTALMPMVWAFNPFVSSLKIQIIRFEKKIKKDKACDSNLHSYQKTNIQSPHFIRNKEMLSFYSANVY